MLFHFGCAFQLVWLTSKCMHLPLPILQLQSCNLKQVASPSVSMQFHASPKLPAEDYNLFCQTPRKAYVTTPPVSAAQLAFLHSSAAKLHKVPLAFNLGISSRYTHTGIFQPSSFAYEGRFQWPPDSAELSFHHLPFSRHTYKMLPIKMSHFVKWYLHIFSII